MAIDYNLLRVTVDLGAIQNNFRLLRSLGTALIVVVKSDAYGHGLLPVARSLEACGAESFAVGTVAEAVRLRPVVRGDIFALLGPQSAHDADVTISENITSVVSRLDQLTLLQQAAQRRDGLAPVALKFDTGMARLGFNETDTGRVLETLAKCPRVTPRWLFSHLATADDPDQVDYVRDQASRFQHIHDRLFAAGLQPRCSLVNSAGMLAYPELAWDRQRPGIALYGANPFHGSALESLGTGLRPAMHVQAPVLAVHPLPKGASISYGRTYVADQDRTVAVVGAGYADNYARSLSNKGWVVIRGQRARILGRVCMQLTAVDVTHIPDVTPDDRVDLLGGSSDAAVTPEELATWWETIPYEVFCLLGMNPRKYIPALPSPTQRRPMSCPVGSLPES
ncbi:alanine racemase [Desulfonatronum thioautotrophicum]|uniref:alanine racemase n=1 Tax=Desulfonatronum thioautotrophicum TaxID=617001 RepID=UPI0009FCD70B|nr:alanine racemase [Desulfonatronum thioautotrophicum]